MIRAVIRDGAIHPIDPLPPEWREGQPLIVDPASDASPVSDLDHWYDEVRQACAAVSQDDLTHLESALAEADTQAKAAVRTQMGLGH